MSADSIEFTCPFCGLKCEAGTLSMDGMLIDGITHGTPACTKFFQLDADDFMVAVNDATLDPVALAKFRAEWKGRLD